MPPCAGPSGCTQGSLLLTSPFLAFPSLVFERNRISIPMHVCEHVVSTARMGTLVGAEAEVGVFGQLGLCESVQVCSTVDDMFVGHRQERALWAPGAQRCSPELLLVPGTFPCSISRSYTNLVLRVQHCDLHVFIDCAGVPHGAPHSSEAFE